MKDGIVPFKQVPAVMEEGGKWWPLEARMLVPSPQPVTLGS